MSDETPVTQEQVAALNATIEAQQKTIDEQLEKIVEIERQLLPKPISELDTVLVSDITRQLIDLVGSLDALLAQNLLDKQADAIRQATSHIMGARAFLDIAGKSSAWKNESRS